MRSTTRLCILLASLVAAASAAAVQDCELNGERVSPNNGATTAGKTGIMRCKDRDSGQLVREQELKAGQFMGLVRTYEDGKLQRDYTENERGNRQGRYREFSAGQLLRDQNYDNGDEVGLSRSYHPNGQLRRATWYVPPNGEQAYAEFTSRGQLLNLRCGDKPLLAPAADDARWCGFAGGPSSVEFFGERGSLNARSSYLAGKRIRRETFNDNGKPNYFEETGATQRVERFFSTSGVKLRELVAAVAADGKSLVRVSEQEFSDNGTLKRDRRWVDGKAATDTTYYLNGQPRSKAEYSGVAPDSREPAWLQTTEYYDSGKVASTGRYSNAPRTRQMPVGTHQVFNEAGVVVGESVYDERGRITREKTWDAEGRLLRDDAVFEDGSRKAFAR
ncbi:MAG: hypothetical protein JWQ72_3210 [Polaromonas sp.]|nr:hypothetical protein [Polaromonas sp.]